MFGKSRLFAVLRVLALFAAIGAMIACQATPSMYRLSAAGYRQMGGSAGRAAAALMEMGAIAAEQQQYQYSACCCHCGVTNHWNGQCRRIKCGHCCNVFIINY